MKQEAAHFGKSFEPQVVSFYRLYAMAPGKPAVPIHHERNVFRDGPLTESPNEQRSELHYAPFDGR